MSADPCLSCPLPDCDDRSPRCPIRLEQARAADDARLQREQAERREWQLTDNDRNRWRVLGSPW